MRTLTPLPADAGADVVTAAGPGERPPTVEPLAAGMGMTMPILHDALELTGHYELDPAHTRVGFAARHAMVTTVRGHFTEFSGGVFLDADAPCRSRAELVVDTASVTTGQQQRDAHLRSPDFFDVDTYPELLFTSTGVEPVGGDDFRMVGDLTVRAVTRPVVVAFTFQGVVRDPFGSQRAGFAGRASVRRSDFGLTYNAALELGGFLVSDEVTLEFDVSAIKSR